MSAPTDHPYDFDPAYGFRLDDLLALRPPEAPPGFDDFWRARYRRALATSPRPTLSETETQHRRWRVQDVGYTSTDDFPIGGWLLTPRRGRVRRGLVVGHGYGGRDGPDFDIPVDETAVLFPCFRGLSRSRGAAISSDPQQHVLHDIDQPDRYILGGCVDDLWLAASALERLFPEVAGRIGYAGTSFGGGIGALAIARDARIDRGHLEVPTFGNMPLWLTLPTVGSGHAAQGHVARRAGAIETLRLFDAATAATRIQVPMLIAVARFDPVVAPPCQFSVANAVPTSNVHETVILDAGHVDYPGIEDQHARLAHKVGRFFEAT